MVAPVEEIGIGDGVFFGGFVADVVELVVPAAAGVGDVTHAMISSCGLIVT